MILDMFSELQRPGVRVPGFEQRLYADCVEQAVLADESGFGCWWAVEHHGSPEFSYSAAPDMMLAVISQHTQRIRLGHSGVLAPFAINHPLRVAERAAFLDNVSGGRLELGLARSVPHEWETFGADPEATREEIREALRMIPQMWAEGSFHWDSEHIRIPEREIVPKPLQQPHPPLWVTSATPEGFEAAGAMGVGVLGTVMLSPLEYLGTLLDHYRRGVERCEPIGEFATAQSAFFAFVHCAETTDDAIESRAAEAVLWFMNSQPAFFGVERRHWIETIRGNLPLWSNIDHHVEPGQAQDAGDLEDPVPVIRLMNRLHAGLEIDPVEAYEALLPIDSVIIGDPEACRPKITRYADLGVDRLMCLMQMGHLEHRYVMQSIRSLGKHLVPEFSGDR
jgi:alkanesulfonate monooxygenase SsuD/methylene tetrahydromethanopterin reductase-like flavin-dependent oxidoreductase (luciferase family)